MKPNCAEMCYCLGVNNIQCIEDPCESSFKCVVDKNEKYKCEEYGTYIFHHSYSFEFKDMKISQYCL